MAEATRKQPSGMLAFTIMWFGQVVSLLGSSMSSFALTIWAWQITGQATALALVGFFSFAPSIIVSPFAGALVDRWNRKLVLILSDLATGLSTIAILLLYHNDALQIWHLYVAGAFASIFQSFQWPAYSAAVSTMLPKQHYARASGMMSMAESAAGIVAPALAGFLLTVIGIGGILIIDIVTFVFAVSVVLFVNIPQPTQSEAGAQGKGSLWSEAGFGFRYILARPSLLGLQLTFFMINFVGSFEATMTAPMILARTDSNSAIMGTVQSAMGIGGVIGGLMLSVWGGPKRKVHGVLGGMALSSFFGGILMGLGQNTLVWSIAGFGLLFVLPVLNGSNQAIWQAKVPPDIQGRVFAVRRMIAQISGPIAILIVGPLADKVFEPRMAVGGAWVDMFGSWVSSGKGAGIALIMVLSGIVGIAVAVIAYGVRVVRHAEDLIPDHQDSPSSSPELQAEPA